MTYSEPQPDLMADLIATLHLVTASRIIAEISHVSTTEAFLQIKAETQALTQTLNREQIFELSKAIDKHNF